ncbi:MAG: hypothetical protein AVDCRST_MAG88-4152, partial [uncultured Thermomicrobiales bacterium]
CSISAMSMLNRPHDRTPRGVPPPLRYNHARMNIAPVAASRTTDVATARRGTVR